ncbi:MAG TPA: hypothetical protein VG167_18925 [Verrucomicrobiae bacterium]|nr:hypothetical protein [Verrucomicrobiae bacterium]
MTPDVIGELLDGILDREADLGATLAYAGATYPCCGGDQLAGKLLQAGGFRITGEVTIVLRVAVFPPGTSSPSQKQSIAYTSTPGAAAQTLRINTVNTLWNTLLVLDCHDPNQAA